MTDSIIKKNQNTWLEVNNNDFLVEVIFSFIVCEGKSHITYNVKCQKGSTNGLIRFCCSNWVKHRSGFRPV